MATNGSRFALSASLSIALLASSSPTHAQSDAGATHAMDASVVDASVDAGVSAEAGRSVRVVGCVPGDGRVLVTTLPEIDLECSDDWRSCDLAIDVRVENCTRSRVALRELRVRYRLGGPTLTFEPRWIEPGTSLGTTYRSVGTFTGPIGLEASVVDQQLAPIAHGTLSSTVRNRRREAAIEACRQCRGRWGAWGIHQREGCNCRASDAGRVCEDGADCEGLCVPTGVRVVTPAVPAQCTCPEGCQCRGATRGSGHRARGAGLVCAMSCSLERPATVVSVGRCSDYRWNFGCRSFIPVGARNEPPRAANLARIASYRCAD
ncbi:MAG: hypothetical protein JNK05_36470 [Myxococcales bacterium]|nr:hypothetical protein [Myxococcales bacterium]